MKKYIIKSVSRRSNKVDYVEEKFEKNSLSFNCNFIECKYQCSVFTKEDAEKFRDILDEQSGGGWRYSVEEAPE